MQPQRVIEAIIITIIMAAYAHNSPAHSNRRRAALTGEMLMEYADLSGDERREKTRKEKEKLTSYLSPRNNILRLPVSHIRGGGTLNEVDGGRNDEEDELGEV